MLTIQLLRNDKDLVLQGLKKKHFGAPELVDQILQLDEERRKVQTENDELLSRINAASKEIGKLMATGQTDAAEAMKSEVAANKENTKILSEKLSQLEKQQHDMLVQLPNLANSLVPEGKHAEDNLTVRSGNALPELGENALPHWDLCSKYNLINFELGNKISGAGFPVYVDKGARLQRALIAYFLDFNTRAGYTEYQPPYVVNADSGYGTGQLPDKEGQMYHVGLDDLYLIPTAEVPLTNLYRDVLIKESELPIRMTGYTPCFRREAGSYGKDVRGLNRLHQFDKVEIVQFAHPDQSYAVLDEMVAHVERLVQSLGLPYRILQLCGGDMSFASALTYDFEVYSAAQKRWLEVSSVSNFETFQTNRMKFRFKNAEGKTQLVHSLNGSSLALPRIVACLLENNQSPEGIVVPEVLRSYMGMDIIN